MIKATVRHFAGASGVRVTSLLDELARQAPEMLGCVCVLPDRCLTVVNTPLGRALLEVSYGVEDRARDIISALVMRVKETR